MGKVQRHWRLALSLQKIQEHLKTLNTMELHWVHKSTNGLADRLANKGVGKEGLELDTTWSSLSNDELKTDCIHLATKYHEGRLIKKGHIEKGIARPGDRQARPRKEMMVEHSITNDHAGSA
jgi:hypothetical protein